MIHKQAGADIRSCCCEDTTRVVGKAGKKYCVNEVLVRSARLATRTKGNMDSSCGTSTRVEVVKRKSRGTKGWALKHIGILWWILRTAFLLRVAESQLTPLPDSG